MMAETGFIGAEMVAVLLSMGVGTGWFAWSNGRKAKRESTRQKAVNLIEGTGQELNSAFSLIHKHILKRELAEGAAILDKAKAKLFTHRLEVKCNSRQCLKSDDFWKKYDALVQEINDLVVFMMNASGCKEPHKLVEAINLHQQQLAESWPIRDEQITESMEPPFDALLEWNHMLFNRANDLLNRYLKEAIR